jgi:membrane-bound lytic murein transglycosylase F
MKQPVFKRYYSIFLLALGLVLIALNRTAFIVADTAPHSINIDTLTAVARDNRSDFYLYHGEPAGFHLELIRTFAHSQHIPYRILMEPDAEKRFNMLLNNKADIIVSSRDDDSLQTVYKDEILISVPFEENMNSVWITRNNEQKLLELLNLWIVQYRGTKEYSVTQNTYFVARLNFPAKSRYSSLSPYDKLIKRYAPVVQWDWRLLASLLYQESRFDATAESPRGAYGLMQIMPRTAEYFKVDDLQHPENNIIAGVRLIGYLQRNLKLDDVSDDDKVKFVLAAYNAGFGRINDCRKFAESQGMNPNVWDDVASVIPLMKHEVFYSTEVIQLGRFKGKETLNFVNQIIDRYNHYKVLVKE